MAYTFDQLKELLVGAKRQYFSGVDQTAAHTAAQQIRQIAADTGFDLFQLEEAANAVVEPGKATNWGFALPYLTTVKPTGSQVAGGGLPPTPLPPISAQTQQQPLPQQPTVVQVPQQTPAGMPQQGVPQMPTGGGVAVGNIVSQFDLNKIVGIAGAFMFLAFIGNLILGFTRR